MNVKKLDKEGKSVVYDISLDGTVVNALGMNVLHNTDGFNFKIPDKSKFRYTEEHPYISNGEGRNTTKGQAYIGVEGDLAEFEDKYFPTSTAKYPQKRGISIDEEITSSINIARKNYLDLMPDGSIKMVGNTLKSKKMPIYIEKFIQKATPMLLHGQGKEFIEYYYDYIEKIFNMRIPLCEIASVGKIKISLKEYKQRCGELTKGGVKKPRQACYELAIKDDLDVHMGDAIYYMNTGTKRGDADVKKSTIFYTIDSDGNRDEYLRDKNGDIVINRAGRRVLLTTYVETCFKKYRKTNVTTMSAVAYGRKILHIANLCSEDVISFNCIRLPNEMIENEEETFCDENIGYNIAKYIDMFNNRIKPLFVSFDRSVRGEDASNMLITDPKDRKYFTDEECTLVSGQPFYDEDQDSYEQLMTMEDKEIFFWKRVNRKPPFVEESGVKIDYDL